MTTFHRAVPGLHVSDMKRALEFWTGTLGFAVTFTNGDPVCFAILHRDGVDMHIGLDPEAAGYGHCHMSVDSVDRLYERCLAAGVTVKQPPRLQAWGLRDILVCDPDGNTLEIAERPANSQGE